MGTMLKRRLRKTAEHATTSHNQIKQPMKARHGIQKWIPRRVFFVHMEANMKCYHTLDELLNSFPTGPPDGITFEIQSAFLKAWTYIHGHRDSSTLYPRIMVSVSGGADSDIIVDLIERIHRAKCDTSSTRRGWNLKPLTGIWHIWKTASASESSVSGRQSLFLSASESTGYHLSVSA